MFCDVYDSEGTVVIRLRDGRYAQLTIQVDDPRAKAADVHTALGEEHNSLGEVR